MTGVFHQARQNYSELFMCFGGVASGGLFQWANFTNSTTNSTTNSSLRKLEFESQLKVAKLPTVTLIGLLIS